MRAAIPTGARSVAVLLNHLTGMAIRQIIALLAEEYDTELDIRDRMLKHALVWATIWPKGLYYLVP